MKHKMHFEFSTTPITHKICEIIVSAMVDYLKYSEKNALELINNAWFATDQTNEIALSHDTAYFWAWAIHFHPKNNNIYQGKYREWWFEPIYSIQPIDYKEWFLKNGWSDDLEMLRTEVR